ncbi:unnamed protein product [Heterobilharzia americana]|nr:unnamed protein product [Heterobilharzia americana]
MISVKTLLFLFDIIISINSGLCLDNGLARTPPMGWMSWQRFRCQIDCQEYPYDCISEKLIQRTADKLILDGWRDLGYKYIIIDDCWQSRERDKNTNEIIADPNRFPNDSEAKVVVLGHVAEGYNSLERKDRKEICE